MKPRRWFRFSLRTMLVAVTAVAMLLGWFVLHRKWIGDREEARKWVEARGGGIVYAGRSFSIAWSKPDRGLLVSVDGGVTDRKGKLLNLPRAPWSLRVLGEKSAYFVILGDDDYGRWPPLDMREIDKKLPELRRVFPEANIIVNFVRRD